VRGFVALSSTIITSFLGCAVLLCRMPLGRSLTSTRKPLADYPLFMCVRARMSVLLQNSLFVHTVSSIINQSANGSLLTCKNPHMSKLACTLLTAMPCKFGHHCDRTLHVRSRFSYQAWSTKCLYGLMGRFSDLCLQRLDLEWRMIRERETKRSRQTRCHL